MTDLILTSKTDLVSPFDAIRGYRSNSTEYWTARELTSWLGYTNWRNGEKAIDRAIKSLENQGFDVTEHIVCAIKLSNQHRNKVVEIKDYELSRFACYLVAMNSDPDKEMVAQAQGYFAFKTRQAEIVIPAQNDRLRELELELAIINSKERLCSIQGSMLTLHGKQVVLALAGCSDAIVREQIVVTEVFNPNTGASQKFLSANQLKSEVEKRTGQKLKTLKNFTDALRKANRDDLLVPVTRPMTSEYIQPEKLDEAIEIVYGTNRQVLIGE